MHRIAAAVLVVALAGCDSKAPDPAGAGGLNISIPPAPVADTVFYARGDQTDTLDPQGTEWGGSVKVFENLFDTLVEFGEDSAELVPGLAEKWEPSDGGKTWTFTLREGVKFHDGTPLDAAAVVFTFDRLMGRSEWKPPTAPYGDQYIEKIDKVEAPGARTVVFRLKSPSAVFLQILAMFPASIVSPAAVKLGVDAFGIRNPIGTGPMKFRTWERNVRIVLLRNPEYWGASKARMERLIILDVPDAQTAIQKLVRGEVHASDHLTLADVAMVEKQAGLRMEYETGLNVCYLGFNWRQAPYSDPNFRHAVACAIDRKKLIDIAYHGRAEAAKSLVPGPILPCPAGAEVPGHDLARAKEFLAKVKLPAGFQPTLWHMTYPRPYVPEPDKVALVLKDALAALGLTLKLEGFNQSAYSKKLHDPEHPMVLLGWSADYADPDNFFYALLHGDSMGDRKAPTGNNITFFDHPEFNKATAAAQTELEAAKRRELYAQAARIYAEELPSFPLVHVQQMAACTAKTKYNKHPIQFRLWTIEAGK